MKRNLFAISLFLIPFLGFAQNNYDLKLDEYLKAYATTYDLHGSVLITKEKEVVYKNSFGFANREWLIKNTIDTRFPIASLTKQFTAAAILKLAEQGKISVDDKLSDFYPDYPRGDSITIHMLLNHTSGIKEYSEKPELFSLNSVNNEISNDSIVKLFKTLPFNFSPGSFWSYSNTGYILLGYIIEKISGKSYGDFINDNIFQPANMLNSGLFEPNSIIPKRAYGYSKSHNGFITHMALPFNIGYSDGGLYSTTEDLSNWTLALYSNNIITNESLSQMLKPNHEEGGAGYGIFIENFLGKKVAVHSGNIPGYSSVIIRFLNEEIGIIILTNRETNLDFLPKGIAAILFDQDVIIPYPHKAIPLKSEHLKKFTAKFETPFPFEVLEKKGKLFMSFGREIELVPESKNKLFASEPDVDIQIEYVFNDQNDILQVYFIEGGVKTEIKMMN